MKLARLDVYSHNFAVSRYNYNFFRRLGEYIQPLVETEFRRGPRGRMQVSNLRVYAARLGDKSVHRFHRTQLDEFLKFMAERGYSKEDFEIVYHDPKPARKLQVKLKPEWKARDYQVPIVAFVVDPLKPLRVVPIQTGKGKTSVALLSIAEMDEAAGIVVPAMFTEQWYNAISNTFECKKGDVLMVKGLGALYGLIRMAKEGTLNTSFMVISSTTMQLFLRDFERDPVLTQQMGCHPEELFDILGIGVRVIDEVHKNFHLNFRMDMYTNIRKTISLSATLRTENAHIRRMYDVVFPRSEWYEGLEYDRYVDVIALDYSLQEPRKAKWKDRKGNYSHVEYEKWLMRNPKHLERYVAMILEIIDVTFAKQYRPGLRHLTFAATVEFCTLLTERLRKRYPGRRIGRYTQEDDFNDMLKNDYTVSTVLSAGTAVDIPGLYKVLMTTSIRSVQANEQAKGRLRKMSGEFEGFQVEFYYLYASNLDKQLQYHHQKEEQFRGYVRTHRTQLTGRVI